jgi:phage shock protein C
MLARPWCSATVAESGIMVDMNGANAGKRLERKVQGRMLAGVCAGLADYLGLDPTLVRVVVAVLALFGGAGLVVYVVGWALIPEEGEPTSIAEKLINKGGSASG